jgi:hypothetical protein
MSALPKPNHALLAAAQDAQPDGIWPQICVVCGQPAERFPASDDHAAVQDRATGEWYCQTTASSPEAYAAMRDAA